MPNRKRCVNLADRYFRRYRERGRIAGRKRGGSESGAIDLKAVHRDRVRLLNALKAFKQGDFLSDFL
ncbi:MAG: hypothetical protein U0586_06260 [Candidatus Brocadiaceae bacterium]